MLVAQRCLSEFNRRMEVLQYAYRLVLRRDELVRQLQGTDGTVWASSADNWYLVDGGPFTGVARTPCTLIGLTGGSQTSGGARPPTSMLLAETGRFSMGHHKRVDM